MCVDSSTDSSLVVSGVSLLAPHEAGMARAEHRCEGDGPHLASSLDAPRLRPRVEDRRYAPSENGIDVHHPADSRPCAARRGGKHIMWEGSRDRKSTRLNSSHIAV